MSWGRRLLAWARGRNYDVGVRYWPVARAVRRADPVRRWRVLDVGSGSVGITPYLPGWSVTRTDTQSSEPAVRPFVRASVLDLPFRDGAWDAVTCVDVIEHLCEPDRERALAELVRVSRRLLVVAFPSGPAARSADERMNAAYAAAGRSAPDWVLEHLRNTYPEPGFLDRLVPKLAGNRPFQEQRVFNESLALQRSHRFLSVRFTAAYKVWTLACGLLLPLLARPLPARSAYRCIGVVRFGDPGEPA